MKLAAVATNVLGKSGRDMLEALIGGEQRAEVLAELARGRGWTKLPQLRRALEGRVQPQHAFLLTRLLAPSDFLEEALSEVHREIEQRLWNPLPKPWRWCRVSQAFKRRQPEVSW